MKTIKQWNKKGRRIHKGEKASKFDGNGKALFSKKQTYIPCQYYEGSGSGDQFYFGGDNPDQMDYDLGLCGQI